MKNEIMNPEEVAKYLRISRVTLYKLLKSGEIPAKKIGDQWRISKAGIDRILGRWKKQEDEEFIAKHKD